MNTEIDQMCATPEIWAAMKVCNGPRQDILISMAYQMGVKGLAKFANTLAFITAGNYTGAAAGMLTSTWAQQTPARAKRHAEVMRTGSFVAYQSVF